MKILQPTIVLIGLLVSAVAPASAAPIFYGPTPYLQASESPFSGVGLSYFFLEDFEDALLNTPGVSSSAGGVTGPGGITDSVDADDGAIDGSGQAGRSFFGGGSVGFTFTFDESVLGAFPTHAGIVWTDGAAFNEVTFEAWDALGVSLGTIVAPNIGDGNFLSGTAEDRFFGVSNEGGISQIRIFNSVMSGGGSGIEADHLQYGGERVQAVPEPATLLLVGAGLGLVAKRSRRKGSPRS
jgi:hypothetical protein